MYLIKFHKQKIKIFIQQIIEKYIKKNERKKYLLKRYAVFFSQEQEI